VPGVAPVRAFAVVFEGTAVWVAAVAPGGAPLAPGPDAPAGHPS